MNKSTPEASLPRVHIDTNVFVDFYQAATDRLKLFHELVERADKVILTEQVIREFRRNRSARLMELANNIENKSTLNIYTTSVVRELPQFMELVKTRDAAKALTRAIASQFRDWVKNESSDPVLIEFENLVSKSVVLPTTDYLIKKAHRRKILGEPPTTPDKHTIGDELIWETLLDGCSEDLIVVSRDGTFINNENILRNEFELLGKRRKRHLVLVTSDLGIALSKVGKPSEEIDATERRIREEHKFSASDEVCPKCGGDLEMTGFEGSDGDEAWWLYCLKCGHEVFP